MKIRVNVRSAVIVGSVMGTMLVFQNCAGGFQSSPLLSASSTNPSGGGGTGAATGTIQVQLTWSQPSTGQPTGYYIQQSTDGTNFTQVSQVSGTTTTATVASLSATKYYFKVVSYNQVGEASSQVLTADLTSN